MFWSPILFGVLAGWISENLMLYLGSDITSTIIRELVMGFVVCKTKLILERCIPGA
jgi:hypothetical protein